MKKLLVFLLALSLLGGVALAAMSSSRTGKQTVGYNYLVWGVFNNAGTVEANITTGLKTIFAFGLNITSEARSDIGVQLRTQINAGTIEVLANTTLESVSAPDGLWWAIGR